MRNEERKLWICLAVSVGFVLLGLGGLFVYAHKHPAHQALQSIFIGAGSRSSAKSGREVVTDPPEAAFSRAMERLADSVREHPELSGEEMVSKVNAGAAAGSIKPCPFEWHNGEAELQIQPDELGKPSLTKTVDSCTTAIKRLPR